MDAWATAGIALAAAVVGGTVEHSWARWRARRDLLEQAVFELRDALPVAVAGLSSTVTDEDALDFRSSWGQARQRTLHLLGVIRSKARWTPGAGAILVEIDDLAARFGAATIRSMNGRPLTAAEVLEVNLTALNRAVFGPEYTLETAVDWYLENGFSEDRPPRKVVK